jgi:hypothetical protein
MELTEIVRIANKMRYTIEAVPINFLPISFLEFPHGSCGDASLLLGAYFKDLGFQGFELVRGERGRMEVNSWTSHAWLACGTLIVDITCDQFSDVPEKTIVSSSSAWHAQFKIVGIGSSDFRSYIDPGINELHDFYARLIPGLFEPNRQHI